jgi:16S rRNA processing protein RimM
MARPPRSKSDAPVSPALIELPGNGLVGDEVELGEIVGVFGFRGEVRVHLHNREDSALLDHELPVVLVDRQGVRRGARVRCRVGAGRRILGRVTGVETEQGARALMGTRLAVSRAALPSPDPGEFYVADLIGLDVVADGEVRGRVVDVATTPAGDLLELDVAGETIFVAFAGAQVIDVDLGAGRVVVDPDALVEP